LPEELKNNSSIKTIVLFDFISLNDINDNEKRNYHLWKYIISFLKLFSEIFFMKLLYVYFASECLAKNKGDYSAFSFLVNVFEKDLLDLNLIKQDKQDQSPLNIAKKQDIM
jgi:hypothetical protein